jgi:hypothetical protein
MTDMILIGVSCFAFGFTIGILLSNWAHGDYNV